MTAIDANGSRVPIGTIAIERVLPVRERCNSAGEAERRGAPIRGILIIACDAGCSCDVLLVCKLGPHQHAQAAEVVCSIEEEMLIKAVRPVDVGVEAQRVGGVNKVEKVNTVGAGALEVEVSPELVSLAQ